MNPDLLDHLFVLLVLAIAFPIGGWWAYRRFLERLSRDGERALVREYRITLVWLIGLGVGSDRARLGDLPRRHPLPDPLPHRGWPRPGPNSP